jgi:SAM-dependent methyltransferase
VSSPPEAVLWELMRGAMATKALGLAADLAIADALAEGPRPATEVAAETGADAAALRRVLRALASNGVFAEVEAGVFANTGASELLRSGEPWQAFAHLFGGSWYAAVGGLDVQTTAPSFSRVHGLDFWSWLARHPAERAAFDRAMEDGKEQRAELLAGLEWRGDETVVDVGGGNGSLLVELLARRPGLQGIVVDLPETRRDEAELAARGISFAAGSFFERVPRGDVYVLGTVLHNWDDDSACRILATIRQCAPAGAGVLVIDWVVSPGDETQPAKWLDLLMLALVGGRERTEADWRALLERAGLQVESIHDRLIRSRCP